MTDSPPAEEKVEAPAATKDVNPPADSSPAETKGEKGDLLSAVKAALKPKEASPPSEPDPKADPAAKTDADKEGEEGDGSAELTDEETSQLKAKTAKRMKFLVSDAKAARQELETVKPKADQFERMVSWFQSSNLSNQEVNQLFEVGADLKNNPARAYERLKPIYAQLAQMFGDVLPEDLSQKVNRGEMTVDTARELAIVRTKASLADTANEQAREREALQRQEQERSAHVQAMAAAGTEWENSKAKADPDWSLKAPLVWERVELAIRRDGYPKTAADARKMADDALVAVETQLRKFRPAKPEVKPPPSGSSTPSGAKPTTLQDHIKLGLAAARRA